MSPSTPPGGQERRKFPRVHRRVMLRFQCVAPELLRDKALQVGIIMDISKGGLVLRSPRTYLPGAIIELHMPNTEVGPARLFYMRVVWQRRTESVTQFDIAGAFVRYTVSAEPEKKKTARAAGETRRFEATTLGPSTGRTVRRVASAGQGSDRRKHDRWQERIYLKYRCVSKGPFHEGDDRVGLMLDFSRGGFVFAGSVGVGATLDGDVVGEKLQRDDAHERREPFGHGGDVEAVRGRDIRRGDGIRHGDAQRPDFSGGAQNGDIARVGGAAVQQRDERAARVRFGQRAVQELFGFEAFGVEVAGLFHFQRRFPRRVPVGAGTGEEEPLAFGDGACGFARLRF